MLSLNPMTKCSINDNTQFCGHHVKENVDFGVSILEKNSNLASLLPEEFEIETSISPFLFLI